MAESITLRGAERAPARPRSARTPRRLAAAFTLSGIAGLAYELVWTRYLALLVGHAAYAQVLVLAVYLGGTAIGSLLIADRSRALARPLRGYAWAEVGLGAFGLAFHALYLGGQWLLYRVLAPALPAAVPLGAATWSVAVLLILPQAVLLGTTFPLMAAGLVRRSPDAPGWSVADVYRLNTLGGALGVILAGFAAVPALGLPGSAVLAGALNLAAAALARSGDTTDPDAAATPAPSVGAAGPDAAALAATPAAQTVLRSSALLPLLLAATFGSALASFLYEIGWVRMLSLLLGSATHAFELMLSAFLLGLGTGSLVVRRWADGSTRPVRALGAVQWWMGLAALLTLPIYQAGFPAMAWLVTNLPRTAGGYALFNTARYAIALAVMLPATVLAGMTLPLVTSTLLKSQRDERMIGVANGANTVGSLVGAVAGGLVVLPGLGLEGTLALGAGLDMAVGVALLAAAAGDRRATLRWAGAAGGLAAALLVAVTAAVRLDRARLTSGVFRTGRLPADDGTRVVFYQDGATATVAVQLTTSGYTTLSTNGKPDASLPLRWLQRAAGQPVSREPLSGQDESTQIYGPLILLAHNAGARHAAVVGHGSGMSAQLLLDSPRVESLDDIEIEPVMILGSQVFLPANRRPFEDPRARFVLEDARATLAGAGEPLDVVFSEPSNPWVSGVASLFTEQFYQRVRARLSERGVFGQWFHLYEMEDGLLLSVLAALDRTFPDWSAWMVGSSDILVVAGKGPLPRPDWSVLSDPDIRAEISLGPAPTPAQLESLRLFDAAAFRALVRGWEANSDYRPVLDTRAERARFRRTFAEGLYSFADDPLDLPRILARDTLAPLPYDSLPVTTVAPLTRRALAGWLLTRARTRAPAPSPDWEGLRARDSAFVAGLGGSAAPASWRGWTNTFLDVEVTRHGRATGWIDAPFYDALQAFLERAQAPADVRASVELLRGVRAFDFARAAAAADRLRLTQGGATLLPPRVLLDAAIAAYLGTGRRADARAAFDALAPATGRPPDSARLLWLASLLEPDVG